MSPIKAQFAIPCAHYVAIQTKRDTKQADL